jgi:ABC-type branched-subunit amino acid transport system ATPase component
LDPLVVRDLHAYYGKAHVLQGVSLTVPAHKVTGVLGRNGAGKTTLLRSIMRLGPRVEGQVTILGGDTAGLSTDAIARLGVGFMPQGVRVFPRLTVRENILVAAHAVSAPRSLADVLEILPELAPLLSQLAGTLSGGQQQMVGIARSFIMRCRVLLMDEPTEGLMPRLVNHVGAIVRRLAEEGVAVVLVEQNVNLALATCDHIYIVEKGQIQFNGTREEIASGNLLERYLGVDVLSDTAAGARAVP